MGQIYSYFLPESKRKLCDDIVDDIDFSLHVTIHNIGRTPDYTMLLEYLQSTNPEDKFHKIHKESVKIP